VKQPKFEGQVTPNEDRQVDSEELT